jgi:hypothetical protein
LIASTNSATDPLPLSKSKELRHLHKFQTTAEAIIVIPRLNL